MYGQLKTNISPHSRGTKVLLQTFTHLKDDSKINPLLFTAAVIKYLAPGLKIVSKIRAGRVLYYPSYLPERASKYYSIMWIVKPARERNPKISLPRQMSDNMQDALEKRGPSYRSKRISLEGLLKSRVNVKMRRLFKKKIKFKRRVYLRDRRLKRKLRNTSLYKGQNPVRIRRRRRVRKLLRLRRGIFIRQKEFFKTREAISDRNWFRFQQYLVDKKGHKRFRPLRPMPKNHDELLIRLKEDLLDAHRNKFGKKKRKRVPFFRTRKSLFFKRKKHFFSKIKFTKNFKKGKLMKSPKTSPKNALDAINSKKLPPKEKIGDFRRKFAKKYIHINRKIASTRLWNKTNGQFKTTYNIFNNSNEKEHT